MWYDSKVWRIKRKIFWALSHKIRKTAAFILKVVYEKMLKHSKQNIRIFSLILHCLPGRTLWFKNLFHIQTQKTNRSFIFQTIYYIFWLSSPQNFWIHAHNIDFSLKSLHIQNIPQNWRDVIFLKCFPLWVGVSGVCWQWLVHLMWPNNQLLFTEWKCASRF